MNNCKNCGGPLLQLFSSVVCKNDCSKQIEISLSESPLAPYIHLQTWISPIQKRKVIVYRREDKRPDTWIGALRYETDRLSVNDNLWGKQGTDLQAWKGAYFPKDYGAQFIIHGVWHSSFRGWVAFLL